MRKSVKTRKIRGGTWLALAVMFLFCLLSGCGRAESGEEPGDGEGGRKLKVAATLFPYYDFVRQVAGDQVELSLVIPAGMDSHSFEPTPKDIRIMQEADVIIANGGAMEHWVDQVLDSLDTSNMVLLTMMDYVDTVEEEHVEGMEDAHDHGAEDHEHGDEADIHMEDAHRFEADGHEMEIEYDEHIWTSPVNAQAIVKIISQTLMEAAPADSSRFKANADAYIEELKELDGRFRQVVAQGRNHMIVVADKFPFRYFADEYGLAYRAAFSGCSTDTEPSAKTIAYLIDKVKEEQIHGVYYLELSSHRTAEIISEETGAVPLLLHSCHNVTRKQFDEGVTYLQLMNQNVENLRKGLE